MDTEMDTEGPLSPMLVFVFVMVGAALISGFIPQTIRSMDDRQT